MECHLDRRKNVVTRRAGITSILLLVWLLSAGSYCCNGVLAFSTTTNIHNGGRGGSKGSWTPSYPSSSFRLHVDSKYGENLVVETTTTTPSTSSSLSFDDTDGASKGIVSTLTNIVNSWSGGRGSSSGKSSGDDDDDDDHENVSATTEQPSSIIANADSVVAVASLHPPPSSPQELLERLRKDYVERNYLWTGDLDLACFQSNCTFTDPTLTFVGTDTFATNTQNLVPLVETFVEQYESKLLSIELREQNNEEKSGFYVQTRWNMVGSLTASPWIFWKPKIDVIGRTKFWFRGSSLPSLQQRQQKQYYQVYFYDEEWEIPAYQALLQLITPAGTFGNTSNQARRKSE